jgi:hypothetical protein
MRTSTPAGPAGADSEQQLETFIRKFDPTDQRLIRAVRRTLRKRFPTANELVWDNYNFFVIGYSPTERPSDAIVSMAARANGVGLCFIHGASLPDPKKVLLGSGNQTRFIRIESVEVLERPEVKALIAAAIARARARLPVGGRGQLLIRSVSAKQRPRRKCGQRRWRIKVQTDLRTEEVRSRTHGSRPPQNCRFWPVHKLPVFSCPPRSARCSSFPVELV